jgi:GNAT superfamily N-acetyltransferase
MNTPYRFHIVCENDRSGILALAHQLGYTASEQTVADLINLVLKQENHQMVVADSHEQLLGYIHLICNHSNKKAAKVDIAAILITDNHRGKGIGSAFLKEAEKWSKDKDIKTVSIRRNLIRDEALSFFKHHGFAPNPSGEMLIKHLP